MLLRFSTFSHMIPIAEDRVLVVDAISQARLVVNAEIAAVIRSFAAPQAVAEPLAPGSVIAALVERGMLTELSPEEELAEMTRVLSPFHGRDPDALLQKFRREAKEGAEPYWAVTKALGAADFEGERPRVDLVLLGDCDVHMESDFLRREAAGRGLDLRVAATFPDDIRFASDHRHDAILIGALRSRHSIMDAPRADRAPPHSNFLAEARAIIEGLRRHTAAPILIDGLPEPTVQPMGFADRGPMGHRGRFRVANLALSVMIENYPDVHVVDLAAALGAVGAERLLDDGLSGFSHMGSPGWMLQRAEEELRPVHGLFPDLAPLAEWVGGDPYAREAVTARAHLDALTVVLGLDAKKCVIVDLDGVLWPGVLAETGTPFAWTRDDNPHSYVGLFFGLHEALLTLKKRGILLACVSKNDETTVRGLWTYPDDYPSGMLLTPADFVSLRINWDDKVENIRSIAEELGFAPEAFLFIDDSPIERDRVRQRLPQVEVWGDDPFSLRRRLLNDPRLQQARLTAEAAGRTELAKAQLGRQAARAEAVSESDFIASLNVQTRIERLAPGAPLDRVVELFRRTTQFNTTGIKFSLADLEVISATPGVGVYAVWVRDRFGDNGLVGAAVVRDGEIVGFALSCRVLGLGVEHAFLQHILADQSALTARILPTDRNHPVRNLYRDNGFTSDGDGLWRHA
ncbi:MAG TPA: HAD-IIIC family phosphatase [Phenylobacterium sp.]|jgi:FkbH-like protein|uniref:HAD-IIIC family phosphatase n=1 Tax=Phenylobacterium sp. TaxID=1871053 RepID=UPI002D42A52E|nr:HAD-IIIC family phosphatase [Phenylobacterium sp.]HZZ68686.1 HAD-IIIC family phosphatase [Phenylobacterium sp.]